MIRRLEVIRSSTCPERPAQLAPQTRCRAPAERCGKQRSSRPLPRIDSPAPPTRMISNTPRKTGADRGSLRFGLHFRTHGIAAQCSTGAGRRHDHCYGPVNHHHARNTMDWTSQPAASPASFQAPGQRPANEHHSAATAARIRAGSRNFRTSPPQTVTAHGPATRWPQGVIAAH